jgi:Holliday junction resolvase RusA-like endonuclease
MHALAQTIAAEMVLDLPFPPSVNRLWRSSGKDASSRVYLAPGYVRWKKTADALMYTNRGWQSQRVSGYFTADILVCPPKGHPRGDLDNRVKAILDYLQRVGIIADDKYCQRLTIEWVDAPRAPEGARVTVRACT